MHNAFHNSYSSFEMLNGLFYPGSRKGRHRVSVKVSLCFVVLCVCSKIGLPSTRLPLNSNNKQNRVRIGWRIVSFVMDGWKQRRFHPERPAAVWSDKTRECPAGGSKSSRETQRSLQQEMHLKEDHVFSAPLERLDLVLRTLVICIILNILLLNSSFKLIAEIFFIKSA